MKLHEAIANSPEYRKLSARFANSNGKPKGKKNKYGRKAYNHLTKSIKRLKQLEAAKNESHSAKS
jgi:hypothetical protein